jgi:hypothetical protein
MYAEALAPFIEYSCHGYINKKMATAASVIQHCLITYKEQLGSEGSMDISFDETPCTPFLLSRLVSLIVDLKFEAGL